MNNINNLYNFKNPIRHFFNIDKINFTNVENLTYKELAWTIPVKFKIFKTEDTQRTLNFPNILNFYHTLKLLKSESNFNFIKFISKKKRVSPDIETGEFSVLSYDDCIKKDLYNLTKYDKLLMLDIKDYYGRIYTHDLPLSNEQENIDARIASLNNGRTNGLLLGSYISLYLAELILKNIEDELDKELKENKITCEYEYFSDDFYFFCYDKDINNIQKVFNKVLDNHQMELNHSKTIILDFEEYSKNNNLEKLWKKIINIAITKDNEAKEKRKKNPNFKQHPSFFTQLIYRLSQLKDLKYKRIFLLNFFKTNYFHQLNPNHFCLSKSDFNYICYIYKLMPECLLYSLDKIKRISGFDTKHFTDFLTSRFSSSLNTNKQEEQLYFYYAIKQFSNSETILKDFVSSVLTTNNQILISYFIIDELINKEQYNNAFGEKKEELWLQNYHYLLKYDKTDIDTLIPANAVNTKQKDSYKKFYNENISKSVPLLKPITEVGHTITDYLKKRFSSYTKNQDIDNESA